MISFESLATFASAIKEKQIHVSEYVINKMENIIYSSEVSIIAHTKRETNTEKQKFKKIKKVRLNVTEWQHLYSNSMIDGTVDIKIIIRIKHASVFERLPFLNNENNDTSGANMKDIIQKTPYGFEVFLSILVIFLFNIYSKL